MSRTLPRTTIQTRQVHLRQLVVHFDAADGEDERPTAVIATYDDGSHVELRHVALEDAVGDGRGSWRSVLDQIRQDLEARPLEGSA